MDTKTWTRAALSAGVGALFALGVTGVVQGRGGPAPPEEPDDLLEAELDGRNEVSPDGSRRMVGDPNGEGEAFVFAIEGDETEGTAAQLCYVLTVDRIEPATGAHIHVGAEGVNGPVVVALEPPTDGNSSGCVSEDDTTAFPLGEVIDDIFANPSGYYVNVHNETYPNGAIRGQLEYERDDDDDDDDD